MKVIVDGGGGGWMETSGREEVGKERARAGGNKKMRWRENEGADELRVKLLNWVLVGAECWWVGVEGREREGKEGGWSRKGSKIMQDPFQFRKG